MKYVSKYLLSYRYLQCELNKFKRLQIYVTASKFRSISSKFKSHLSNCWVKFIIQIYHFQFQYMYLSNFISSLLFKITIQYSFSWYQAIISPLQGNFIIFSTWAKWLWSTLFKRNPLPRFEVKNTLLMILQKILKNAYLLIVLKCLLTVTELLLLKPSLKSVSHNFY